MISPAFGATVRPLFGLGLLLVLASPAEAATGNIAPTAELTVGPGWRAAADGSDRTPGFDAVWGNAHLLVGVTFGGVGIAAGGNVRLGKGAGSRYLEAGGDLNLQILLGDRVRARAGVAAGEAFVGDLLSAPFVGGQLGLALDVASFAGGRAAVCLAIRLDIDGFVTDNPAFPKVSTALGGGMGFRY